MILYYIILYYIYYSYIMLYSRFFHIEDITRFPVGGARPGQRRAQHRAGARTGADGMER